MTLLANLWRAGVLVMLTVFWSTIALFAIPLTRGAALGPICRWWSRGVLALCGVAVVVEGLDHIDRSQPYLVLANHTSHFDVLAIYSCLPFAARPVAKRELAFIPIFGWVLATGAAIIIDRGDRAKAFRSLEHAGAVIRGGRSVLMFPEGTRTPPGVLGSFKKGPFHLALAAKVPVLPVGVEGSGAILASGDWRIYGGTIHVRFGEAIPVAAFEGAADPRDALATLVSSRLRDLMVARKLA